MKAEPSAARGDCVPLSGPQAASMTLLRATSNGSWPAQLPCFDRFPCPGSILACIPKECIVQHKTNPVLPSFDPPEFPEFTRQNNRNPHASRNDPAPRRSTGSQTCGATRMSVAFPCTRGGYTETQ